MCTKCSQVGQCMHQYSPRHRSTCSTAHIALYREPVQSPYFSPVGYHAFGPAANAANRCSGCRSTGIAASTPRKSFSATRTNCVLGVNCYATMFSVQYSILELPVLWCHVRISNRIGPDAPCSTCSLHYRYSICLWPSPILPPEQFARRMPERPENNNSLCGGPVRR
jgi:hypothetical protein